MSVLKEYTASWKHIEFDWKYHVKECELHHMIYYNPIHLLHEIIINALNYPTILKFNHWYCFDEQLIFDVPDVSYDEYKQFIINSIPSERQDLRTLATLVSSETIDAPEYHNDAFNINQTLSVINRNLYIHCFSFISERKKYDVINSHKSGNINETLCLNEQLKQENISNVL